MVPHANAIRKVLSHIDHHYKHDTTTVARLRCMQSICGIRKLLKVPRTRSRFHDFNSLYKAMERAVKKPENQDARVWAESAPGGVPMEKLFVAGSRVFKEEFLADVGYSASMAEVSGSGNTVPASDFDGAAIGEKKDRMWFNFPRALTQGKVIEEKDSDSGSVTAPPDAEPSPEDADAAERDDHDASNVRGRMLAISTSIEDITKLIFPSDQHSRLAAPTLAPASKLKALYVHVLGNDSWKSVAIDLQAADALGANNFLQALIWSFLHRNILQTCAFWNKQIEEVIFSLGQAGDHCDDQVWSQVRRDISLNQLQDNDFRSTELIPEAYRLAQELGSIFTRHIEQLCKANAPTDRVRREFDRGLREVCVAALLLKGQPVMSESRCCFKWHYYYMGDNFVDATFMEDNGGQEKDLVAFTIMPGLHWKRKREQWKILVRAKVELIKAGSEEE